MEITSTTNKTVVLNLGKIDYHGIGRKSNKAEVHIGFRYIHGNNESYFCAYGHIWNEKETNILYGGAETPSFLFEKFFPNSEILKRIVHFGNKWHLIPFSEIPENDFKEIVELMEEIEDFNGDLKNL